MNIPISLNKKKLKFSLLFPITLVTGIGGIIGCILHVFVGYLRKLLKAFKMVPVVIRYGTIYGAFLCSQGRETLSGMLVSASIKEAT